MLTTVAPMWHFFIILFSSLRLPTVEPPRRLIWGKKVLQQFIASVTETEDSVTVSLLSSVGWGSSLMYRLGSS